MGERKPRTDRTPRVDNTPEIPEDHTYVNITMNGPAETVNFIWDLITKDPAFRPKLMVASRGKPGPAQDRDDPAMAQVRYNVIVWHNDQFDILE